MKSKSKSASWFNDTWFTVVVWFVLLSLNDCAAHYTEKIAAIREYENPQPKPLIVQVEKSQRTDYLKWAFGLWMVLMFKKVSAIQAVMQQRLSNESSVSVSPPQPPRR